MHCLQVKREYPCDIAGGFEARHSIYADNAMLTMRSSAQNYVWRCQGAEEYVLKSSFLLLYFFGGFLFFESNQHSEGVKCKMTVRDDEG